MNKVGRPTNYTPELIKKAVEYIETEFKKDEVIPTGAGLALHLKIPRQKLYVYADKYEEFRDILEGLNALQEKRLLTGGLTNKLNPTIVKLVLAKHGYKEEVGITQEVQFIYTDDDKSELEKVVGKVG